MPAPAEFARIADLTAIRRDATGRFYESNYARGPILYGIIAARRPRAVLELGTGRGYGALSMAWAMADNAIDGRVYTVDVVPHDRPFQWALRDARGVRVELRSRADLWRSEFRPAWTDRIVPLEGRSDQVMRAWRAKGLPEIDLAFVDGGHDRATASHDLLAACALSAERSALLADDYATRTGFGVVEAFRELVGRGAPLTVIYASWGELPARPDEGMAWLALEDLAPEERSRLRQLWDARQRRPTWSRWWKW